ncbi:MAG TPA: AAA family ATPase [Fimbriimonadaceae bacterium]|nr:AAA family ATPase [Fimbriimonadaceae bacterium]
MALAHERTLTRTSAAESLWPDDYYDATRVRLRQELARLRKALGDASEIILIDGEEIRLAGDVLVDVDEYRSTLKRAVQSPSTAERAELLALAADLAEQPLLEEADEPWVAAERAQLDRERYQALLDLSMCNRESGDFEAALAAARRAIAMLPEREEGRLLAVQALADLGHAADAMMELGALKRGDRGASTPHGATDAVGVGDLTPGSVRPLRFSHPSSTEPIYGRERELAEIRSQLAPTGDKPRLVSLLGPGGIGKSRLMLEAASEIRELYQGRLAYADLSELHDARLVPLAILRALRADAIPTENPAERLSAVLPKEPTVLALDNLEQLGARMQVFVRRLLERHPELRILVTSRGALGVAGEHRIQVGPLTVPGTRKGAEPADSPALRMFVDRARAGGIEVEPDETTRSIVRRLEGVPLAIILAAGRLRTLGAPELDAQLQASFDVLSTGRPGVPERHRSIRRAVEGSFNALSVQLQQTLCALAVFRGGWTLAAATDVCQLDDTLDEMEALLDASLIYVSQEGRQIRFRMLESIRSYALSQIDDEIRAAVRMAHAAWIARLADSVAVEFATAADISRFDAVEAEWDNVRAALEFALDEDPELAFHFGASLPFYWRYRSNGFEGFQFYEDLFERYGDLASSEAGARAAFGQVLLLQMLAVGVRSEEQIRALHLAEAAGLTSLCAKLHVIRGTRDQNDQLYAECAAHFHAAEELMKQESTDCDRAFLALHKGYCSYFQGRPDESMDLLQSSYSAFSANGELFLQFRARQLLALAALETGEISIASKALDGLLDAVRSARFLPMLAATYSAEGKLAFHETRYADALDWFRFGREEWLERRVDWQVCESDYWLGRTRYMMGDLKQAESYARRALVSWFDYDSLTATSVGLASLAEILIAQGRAQEAAQVLASGIQQIRDTKVFILASEWAHFDLVEGQLKALGLTQFPNPPMSLSEIVELCRGEGAVSLQPVA